MPLFSIVIPSFNRAALLARTLDSVWRQTFTDYEVIVVDNGSTDDTSAYVCGLGARVRLITQVNLGAGVGRNVGARAATGEYVAFLDSDDIWFPWTLATFAQLITEHGRPVILGAKLVEFFDDAALASVPEKPVRAEVFPDFFAAHRAGYFVGAGMSVLRCADFLNTGGYTDLPINGEDHDLILRMGDALGYVQVIAPVTLGWRRHPGSVTMDLARSVAGNLYLVEQELRGVYPGGASRARERWNIITRHVRPVALEALRRRMKSDAWELYRATFRWHCALGRWKFLLGFPLRACLAPGRRSAPPDNSISTPFA